MPTNVRTKSGRFELRVRTDKLEEWKACAASENLSLARWVEEACDAARADYLANNSEAAQIKLERIETLAKVRPDIHRASALPPPRVPHTYKHPFKPDFK